MLVTGKNVLIAAFYTVLTTKPWSFMLRMRFCPITARPISATSPLNTNIQNNTKWNMHKAYRNS